MSNTKLSLTDQYFALKEQAVNALVLMRVGDFFEFLFDDAKVASDKLGLILTKRDCGGEAAPMCGFPAHAVDLYANKLASLGLKVAICEQKKSDDSKGIMDRTIIRTVTPATITDETLLDRERNNYLLSLYSQGDDIGAGWTDISTGEINYSVVCSLAQLNNLLCQLNPAEIICNSEMAIKSVTLSLVKNRSVCPFMLFDESAFVYANAFKELTKRFGLKRVGEVIECLNAKKQNAKHCISALGALFSYIDSTKNDVAPTDLTPPSTQEFMKLDSDACRTLELLANIVDNKKQGSLIWVLDKTKTAMGARTLRKWILSPLAEKDLICRRHDGVEKLKDSPYLDDICDNLDSICDLERIGTRLQQRQLNPKECIKIAQSLSGVFAIKTSLSQIKSPILSQINGDIDDCKRLCKLIDATIEQLSNNKIVDFDDDITEELDIINSIESADGDLIDGVVPLEGVGTIKSGVNKRLDFFREEKAEASRQMQYIIEREIQLTGLKLKLERSKTYGYYIEVPKAQVKQVPYRFKRIQTLGGAERFKIDVLIETEERIVYAEGMVSALETTIYCKLMQLIRAYGQRLVNSARAIAQLDCLASFAVVANSYKYVRPKMHDNFSIIIHEGRHPVVEQCRESILSSINENPQQEQQSEDNQFIPNDTNLDNDANKIMIITGPNMSGKSVYMRQVALIAIMAHMGSFIPAKDANISIIEQIFTRIGAGDDVSKGRSTFMVEMAEVAYILNSASDRSLILLDEVGRGTSTYDGVSIAWAVIEELAKNYNAKVLFSTHYHELTRLENSLNTVKNYKMTIQNDEKSVVFLRKLERGTAQRSFGIEVASLAGVSENVIKRARQIMGTLDDMTKWQV